MKQMYRPGLLKCFCVLIFCFQHLVGLHAFDGDRDVNACYTNDGYIAAISEKYLDDVVRYSIDKDYVALNKLINAGVAVSMKKGVKVRIVNAHLFSGTVEFRVEGFTEVWWTVNEAIKC